MEFYLVFMSINHKSFPYQPGKSSVQKKVITLIFVGKPEKHFPNYD